MLCAKCLREGRIEELGSLEVKTSRYQFRKCKYHKFVSKQDWITSMETYLKGMEEERDRLQKSITLAKRFLSVKKVGFVA